MTAPCLGVSYLSTGRDDPDDPLELVIECNGGAADGDCGWRVVIAQEPSLRPEGTWDVYITSERFLPLHGAHLAHRAALDVAATP